MQKECEWCGKKHTNKRFCSRECTSAHRSDKGTVEKNCVSCGEKFKVWKSKSDTEYCCWECYLEENAKEPTACEICGTEFRAHPWNAGRFCSVDCMAQWLRTRTGEDNPKYDRIKNVCENCGQEHMVQRCNADRRFCSVDCYFKGRELPTGKDNPNWKRKRHECNFCGDEFYATPTENRSFCSHECYGKYRSEEYVGENHPQWKGGHIKYYGPDWQKTRKKALAYYSRKCAICGKGKEELGKLPDVHHIIPVREFEEVNDAHFLENLVVLCQKHHHMVEGWNLKPEISV